MFLGACAPAGPRPPTVPTAPSVPAATTPGPQPAPPASEPIPARARGAGDATPVKAPPRIHLKIDLEGQYCDFPAVATDGGGVPWVAYVRWDGEKDTIEAARVVAGRIEKAIPVGKPGVIHQPVLAADGGGGVWVIWSQRDERGLMNLMSRRIVDGAAAGEVETLARSEGGNIFPSAASDRKGRVWLVWQSHVRLARILEQDFRTAGTFLEVTNKLAIAERVIYWAAGMSIFREYPILGVGLGNAGLYFVEKMPSYGWGLWEISLLFNYRTLMPNTKSLWVRTLAESGLLGFAVFMGWYYLLWKSAWFSRQSKDPRLRMIGLAGSIVLFGFLFEGFSVDSYALPYFWFSVGLLSAVGSLARWRVTSDPSGE